MADAHRNRPSGRRALASVRAREANRGFFRLIVTSVVVHSGLVGGAIYASSLRPVVALDINAMPVELVTLGKERDPDLLPRKVRRPPPPPPDADAVALDGIVPPKPKPKKPRKRRKMSRAARKLLEGRDEALDDALKKLETPEGSESGSTLGTTTNSAAAATAYEGQVATILRSRYQLPTTIPPSQRRFLEAEMILFINRNGSITRYEYTKRHTNQAFMSALENLLRSVTLPPPPKLLAREYANTGLAVRFKPD